MSGYDPTSPKVTDDFIASDGENDVQGHVYKQEDDIPTEFRAAVDEPEDVEGHFKARSVDGEGFRSLADGDGAEALLARVDEDDVEGHIRARSVDGEGFKAMADADGFKARVEDDDSEGEGFRAAF